MKKFKIEIENSNSSRIITEDLDAASIFFLGACCGLKMRFDRTTNVFLFEMNGENQRIIMMRLDVKHTSMP